MAGDYQTEESEWCSRRRGRKRGAKSGGGVSLKFQNVIRTDCIKNILLHRCYCSWASSANIIINSRARCRFIVLKKSDSIAAAATPSHPHRQAGWLLHVLLSLQKANGRRDRTRKGSSEARKSMNYGRGDSKGRLRRKGSSRGLNRKQGRTRVHVVVERPS